MAETPSMPPWGRFAVLALGATLLFVGGSAVLSSIFWLSELDGEDATMFVMELIQSTMVVGLGAVLVGTAGSYGSARPRLKPAVLLFSLAILATAALAFYRNNEFEEGGYLTEAILLTLVGLGGLVATMMSNPASPNRHNAPVVGAVSALLLFITYLVRDDVLNEYAELFSLFFGPTGFIPGLVGYGAEAVFKLLALLTASVMAAAWPKMKQGSGRALVVLLLGAAAVMLAIGLLIGAIDGFKSKPLDELDGEPGLIVTAQVLFFLSLLTGLAAALLVAGAALIPSLAALNHFTGQPQPTGGYSEPSQPQYATGPPAASAPPVQSRAGPPHSPAPAPSTAHPAVAPPGGRLMKCPKCGASVAVEAGAKPVCPECWYGT